jgi:uracil permease
MDLIYGIQDKPKLRQRLIFAIQQLLAIMAATLVVPVITNGSWAAAAGVDALPAADQLSPAAALFGAGAGTLIYILFTKRISPVFLGSSFAFLGSMAAAFAGSMTVSYLGLIVGAIFAGLVYVLLAVIVRFVGVHWIEKLMPAVVVGPTVAIIGLSLAGNAIGDLTSASYAGGSIYVCLIVGLVTLLVTMCISTFSKGFPRLIPFVLGILAGYATATVFYVIGSLTGIESLKVIDYSSLVECFKPFGLSSIFSVPNFTFIKAVKGFSEITGAQISTVAVAYIPVAFVVFAEHIADHKNLSSIIGTDLLENPGLHRTLLGDGVGSMVGALFGGCPNTTYGESIACVAITRNASVSTIVCTAILAMVIAFLSPFVAFVNTIPSCVMGGVCIALYGFIAVSGLKMIQQVDLGENRNLFVVSIILIAGIGGLTVSFGQVTITEVACALILGIIANAILSKNEKKAA